MMENPLYIFKETVSSLAHRVYTPFNNLVRRIKIWNTFGQTKNLEVDESKVNYYLARSIMDGSIITGPDGNVYGKDYILASAFASPIINAPTGIMLTNPPSVETDNDPEFESTMQQYYIENQTEIMKAIADSQAEGDSYVYIKDTFDATPVPLRPENVEKVVDPNDYTNTIGFNVNSAINRGNGEDVEMIQYKTLYRKIYPYKIVIAYNSEKVVDRIVSVDGKDVNVPLTNESLYLEALATIDDYADLFDVRRFAEERPLPIVHMPFNLKAQRVYGESVFRNLYVYFLNYHRVMDGMLKNIHFNSNSFMYIKGIDSPDSFKQNNGELQTDGTYRLKFTPRTVLFGGSDFEVKHVEAPDVTQTSRDALTLLFYLIVQASEIPEFFFGARMNASDASVREQLPVLVNKVNRYQALYFRYMKLFFDTVIYYKARNGDVTVDPKIDYVFTWGHVSLDSVDDITKLVEKMDELGLITDETKSKIMGMGKFVTDIKGEIEQAKKENEDKGLALDQRLINTQPEKIEEDDDVI
jgi:hypothetical protein